MFSSFSMLPCFCCLYMWNFLLIYSRGPLFFIFIVFIMSCVLPYSCTLCNILGVSVSDIFVSCKSASKPAGLSCELMVACVTFQLLYVLLWSWSCWLLWIVRFCICDAVKCVYSPHTKVSEYFLIWYSYMVLEAGELCPFVIMFICTSQASFYVVVFSVIFSR